MLERQRMAAMRAGERVRENPAPALMLVGLAMLLIAALAGGAAMYWMRQKRRGQGGSEGSQAA